MDTDLKKLLIKIIFATLFFIGLVLLIVPFFNTGLKLNVIPEGSRVEIDGKEFSPPYDIKLSSGKHKIIVSSKDFRKFEKEIYIRKYGRTKIRIELIEKLKPLIDISPYTNTDKPFNIEGIYNKYSEPEYTITLFDSKDKEEPLKWLKDRGIDIEKTKITFIEDGG